MASINLGQHAVFADDAFKHFIGKEIEAGNLVGSKVVDVVVSKDGTEAVLTLVVDDKIFREVAQGTLSSVDEFSFKLEE